MFGDSFNALLISNAHCTGSSGLRKKTSAIPSPVGTRMSLLLFSAAWKHSVRRTLGFSSCNNSICSLTRSFEEPTTSINRRCAISSWRSGFSSADMFSAQAPSFTRSNHRHSTVAGREQIIQARFSAENEHVDYGATCSSNREFVLHCQVRYEANSIDPKSRFKLRSAKIAPILGYIARRPAFRENRGLACAQVSSLSRAFAALHDENWCSPSDALLAKIPTVVIDRIHIEQLEVHGRVGVPDSERAQPQRLTLNLTLCRRLPSCKTTLPIPS